MRAFVFSGGGNRGAMEAGAAAELIAAGVLPDMVIGSSAGALNAAYLAAYGPAAAEVLAQLWAGEAAKHLLPFNVLSVGARLAQGKSMFDVAPIETFLRTHLPEDVTFGELTIPCYVTATDLSSGTLYLYGTDKTAPVADAVLASAAHPLLFEPVPFSGGLLVDGGVVMNAPLGVALDMGAHEVYLINASYGGAKVEITPHLIPVLFRSLDVAFYQPLARAVRDVAARSGVTLHHLQLPADDLQVWDMAHGAELVETGRAYARAYVAGVQIPRQAAPEIEPPPGAVPYTPPQLREEGI